MNYQEQQSDLAIKQDAIQQITEKIINQSSLISFDEVIHMFDLLDEMDESNQKFLSETIHLKLMKNFKGNKINFELQAQIISGLMRRFNNYLSFNQEDFFQIIYSQDRDQIIKSLILCKEITSFTQKMKCLTSYKVCNQELQLSLISKQVSIKDSSEIIQQLMNLWIKNVKKELYMETEKESQEKGYDINLLITCCLVQLQNQMNQKQRKKVFNLVITQINKEEYLEEDKELLHQYLNFLNISDSNFLNRREKAILRKFKILLDMYDNSDLVNEQNKSLEMNQFQLVELSIKVLKQVLVSNLNQNSDFLTELVDLIFAISEHVSILYDSDNNIEFEHIIEQFNQSQKKAFINNQVFNKMLRNVIEVGEGVQNQNDINQIDFTKQQIRKIQGAYNLIYFYFNFNTEYFCLISQNFFQFIQFHIKNLQIIYHSIQILTRIIQYGMSTLSNLYQFFMDQLIDIFEKKTDISMNLKLNIIRLFNQLFLRFDETRTFQLYKYIPRLFQMCLKQFSSSLFNSYKQVFKSSIVNLINTILSLNNVEFYIQNQLQNSINAFSSYENLTEVQQKDFVQGGMEESEPIKNFLYQINLNKCLFSLANMYNQSKNLKNDELISKVKAVLREYANQFSQGTFSQSPKSRSQLYSLFQRLQIKLLNDQKLFDEIFLKFYDTLIADCQLFTDVKTQYRKKNQEESEDHLNDDSESNNEESNNELEEEEELEEVYTIQPNKKQAYLKQIAIFQLEQFIELCPTIVMEHKKFEIVRIIQNILENKKEDDDFYGLSFQLISQMLVCVQKYFEKQLPHLYLDKSNDNDQGSLLSSESKLEYAPLIQILLNEFKNVERQEYSDTFENYASNLYFTLKSLDLETKRTFFKQIFKAIEFHIRQTIDIQSPSLIQRYFSCLCCLFKANPSQIEGNFIRVWHLFRFKAFDQLNQYENKNFKDNDNDSQVSGVPINSFDIYMLMYYHGNSSQDEQSVSQEEKEEEQNEELVEELKNQEQELIDEEEIIEEKEEIIEEEEESINEEEEQMNDNIKEKTNQKEDKINFEEESEDEKTEQKGIRALNEQNSNSSNEKESSKSQSIEKNQGQLKKINKYNLKDLEGLDMSVIGETIGCLGWIVKYNKCVYDIIHSQVNSIILTDILMEDLLIQRNCLFYLSKVTRHCYDSVESDEFQQLFNVVKYVANSQKILQGSELGTIENIYITYCIMAVKLLQNKQPTKCSEEDMIPFNKLFSIIPLQDDIKEMQRFIQICEFLLDFNQQFVLQNLSKIIKSIVDMLNQPQIYQISIKKEPYYQEFYDKLLKRFPQVKTIAKSIIDLNQDNLYQYNDQLLKKLNLI